MRFRTGRTIGRTLYIQTGDRPASGRDIVVGMLDTPALAQLAATALNEYAERYPEVVDEMVWGYDHEHPCPATCVEGVECCVCAARERAVGRRATTTDGEPT